MKKISVVVLLVVALVCAYLPKAHAENSVAGVKMGYVDLNRALNEVNEGKAAKAKLEADGKAKKQKLEIMQNDLKKMGEDLEKQKLILSPDALREKQAQAQQKLMELQKTSMEYEKSFSEAEGAAIKPISEKLQRIIQQIGQTDGYTMIVPREMALYSPAGTDLTDKVIATYNGGKGK
jgi:outer membrane protein